VLAFIPFGIYISMLKPNWSFLKKIAVIAGVSLLFEVLQFIFAIGASDITDLLGNTLGGIIGIGVYIVFCRLFSTKANKILNVLTSIGVIFLVALVLVLISGVIRFK
ncbi:VanZ family protein, partial [Gottfriedia acidiceleris]